MSREIWWATHGLCLSDSWGPLWPLVSPSCREAVGRSVRAPLVPDLPSKPVFSYLTLCWETQAFLPALTGLAPEPWQEKHMGVSVAAVCSAGCRREGSRQRRLTERPDAGSGFATNCHVRFTLGMSLPLGSRGEERQTRLAVKSSRGAGKGSLIR